MTYARWKRGRLDPVFLVQKLEELRMPASGGGEVTFSGDPYFEDVVTVLESGIEFLERVPEGDQRAIVGDALWAAAAAGPLTQGSLIGKVNEATRDFIRSPEQKFVLATSLSVKYFSRLNRTEVSGCKIYYRANLDRRFQIGRQKAMHRSRRYLLGEPPPDLGLLSRDHPDPGLPAQRYTAVWVHTAGRSEYEAATRALAALDLQRGIWNLALNRRRWSRTTAGRRKPVNQVLLGPLHSLHHPDGRLAAQVDWYEYDYVEPIQSKELGNHWTDVKTIEKNVRSCLARSRYRDDLEEAIRRYSRALDSREWDAAFVQLWALLENLTGTKATESHELSVNRASFLYVEAERELHLQVLDHLRHYRNRNVHGGKGSEDIESYLYQLKRYVEELLNFHLANPFGLESIEEAAKVLSLPAKPADLHRKEEELAQQVAEAQAEQKLVKIGLRYRSGP